MILEVLADTRKFRNKIHASVRQNVLWADAAMKQDSWTTDRTSREDNFFVNLDREFGRPIIGRVLNGVRGETAGGGRIVEKNASDMSISKHIVVAFVWKRVEISGAAIGPSPVRRIDA